MAASDGFEPVSFYSGGSKLAGLLRRAAPDAQHPSRPGIVICAGFTGTKAIPRYLEFGSFLSGAGFDVLTFDHRGWGESEGPRGAIRPLDQVEDVRNAVTYLTSRSRPGPAACGLLGFSFGGANAAWTLATDPRVRAAVVVNAIGDGREWLRRLRTEHDWDAWLDELARARTERVLTGADPLVDPIRQIMVETPARRDSPDRDIAADSARTPLSCADAILDFHPADALRTGLPGALCVISTSRDTTTPEEHAHLLHDAARGPKQLLVLPRGDRYPSYMAFGDRIIETATAWFREHLAG